MSAPHRLSLRTGLLLIAVILLLSAVLWTRHRQRERCGATVRTGARRAPIPGASGGPDASGCTSLASAPPASKAIDAALALTLLALLRSILIDRRRYSRSSLPME